jgi:stage II sporulation protein D
MAKRILACFVLLAASASSCFCQQLRIRVLSRYHPTELELRTSGAQALVIEASGERLIVEPNSSEGKAQIKFAEGQLLLALSGQRLHVTSIRVTGRTGAADFVLAVPGKISRRYLGMLDVAAKDGELEPIVTMDLETAVASVVQAETEAGTPIEALKAQAVVTRSYFVAAKGRHQGFDFCDLAHCQVLRGVPPPGSAAARAAAETRGLVLTYESKPFAAMFTRSCSGHTRTPFEDGLPANGYPYFPVVCDYCAKAPFRWTRKLSSIDAAIASRGENGRLTLCRRLGWNSVPSDDFSIHKEGLQAVLVGEGQGHGIGLCQRGAEAMAANGADFRAILVHYFPNVTISY